MFFFVTKEKNLGGVNSQFRGLFGNFSLSVCLSVCLPKFSESADARDVGLITLYGLITVLINDE